MRLGIHIYELNSKLRQEMNLTSQVYNICISMLISSAKTTLNKTKTKASLSIKLETSRPNQE